jgi:hypothetical protein
MRYIIIAIICLIQISLLSASEIPVGSPVSDRLFIISRELYGRGLIDRFEYSSIGNASSSPSSSFEQNLIEQLNSLKNDFISDDSSSSILFSGDIIEKNIEAKSNRNYLKAFPYIRINFNKKLSANILYRIDGELSYDPRYEGKEWNGIAGFPENATLEYRSADFGLRFGTERLSWGFADYGNLMFSRQAMPMPLLGVNYHRWIFDFQSVLGFLSPLKNQLDKMENDTSFFTSQQRYISAHSLTLRPLRGFSITVREAVLYGGTGRRIEPIYMFPFVWYHGQQLNSRLDDNILTSLAADYRLSGKLWFYGEFLVDDFQIDKKTRGDYEPNQLGYLAGVEAYDIGLNRSTIALEYNRVNNWTYNQARAHNRYINGNFPIGFPDGPDLDRWNWRLSWWLDKNIKLSYLGYIQRHGEGRIDTPWSRPWLLVDSYSESFPSGIVERTVCNDIEMMIFDKNWLWGNFGIKFTDINNVENSPGKDSQNWEFRIDMGIKLPPFSWGF